MKVSNVWIVIVLGVSLGLFSCGQQTDFETQIFTEEVVYLSGEVLRVSGRIVGNREIDASDHGFQVADNPEFATPIMVSLGARQLPGRFIGTHEGLDTQNDYFVRAYLVLEGTTIVSEPIEFSVIKKVTP